jgi:hypothetical protein
MRWTAQVISNFTVVSAFTSAFTSSRKTSTFALFQLLTYLHISSSVLLHHPLLHHSLSNPSSLFPHPIIAMDIDSPPPVMSPEQIGQETAAINTTLATLAVDANELDDDILDVSTISRAVVLQRRFFAVQGVLLECVDNCKKLAANFQSLSSILLTNQERSELEDLRRENQRLRKIVASDNSQLTAVQHTVNDNSAKVSDISQQLRNIERVLNRVTGNLPRDSPPINTPSSSQRSGRFSRMTGELRHGNPVAAFKQLLRPSKSRSTLADLPEPSSEI